MVQQSILGDFIADAVLSDFPEPVIHQAKIALMDTLGTGLAGAKSRASKIVRDMFLEFPMMPEEATLSGTGEKVSCLWAALANSVAASSLDADDGHRVALGHPGAIIVPAAIAVGERVKVSGKRLLEAIIVGYEVGIRAGMCLNRDHENTYYGSGTWGIFGSTAAASKILGLGRDESLNALGISEIHAPLALIMGWINLRKPPEVKEGIGWASFTGLASALLSQKGMIGSFSLHNRDPEETLTLGLGRDFEINKLYFKKYPACRWAHPPIDAALQAKNNYGVSAEQITRIRIYTFSKACHLQNPRPITIEEAQYSIPFLVGAALVYGKFGPSELNIKQLKDPLILAVAERVSLELDCQLNACYPNKTMARIEIFTQSGERIKISSENHTRGDFQSPLTSEELEEKFRIFAGISLEKKVVEELLQTTLVIETLEDISELTHHLTC